MKSIRARIMTLLYHYLFFSIAQFHWQNISAAKEVKIRYMMNLIQLHVRRQKKHIEIVNGNGLP